MTPLLALRFFNCSHEAAWMSGDEETRTPEFRCEIHADDLDVADDRARRAFDIPTNLCCCEPVNRAVEEARRRLA